MSSTSAVFVGDGTLLVRCAQAWRDAGHEVAFVATRNGEIAQWARASGVAHRCLARDEPHLTQQDGPRSFFGRDRRPDALATIDFTKGAREIAALVRALDWGIYANPLARAKLVCGDRLLVVRAARVGDFAFPPGTVVNVEADAIEVATGDGSVILSGLSEIDGTPVRALPAAGDVLAPLDAQLQGKLAAATPSIARGERHWMRALANIAPVDLPWPRARDAAAAECRVAIDVPADARPAAA